MDCLWKGRVTLEYIMSYDKLDRLNEELKLKN